LQYFGEKQERLTLGFTQAAGTITAYTHSTHLKYAFWPTMSPFRGDPPCASRCGLVFGPAEGGTRIAFSSRLLSVGNDRVLMSSRTLILRGAGYLVEEAYSVEKAVSLVEADSIDATIICHTISKDDQHVLVAIVREKRRLMPVLCIRAFPYQTAPQTCTAIDNQPTELLNAVRAATQPPKTDSLGPGSLMNAPSSCSTQCKPLWSLKNPVSARSHRMGASS
jgi:hypothetical protein